MAEPTFWEKLAASGRKEVNSLLVGPAFGALTKAYENTRGKVQAKIATQAEKIGSVNKPQPLAPPPGSEPAQKVEQAKSLSWVGIFVLVLVILYASTMFLKERD